MPLEALCSAIHHHFEAGRVGAAIITILCSVHHHDEIMQILATMKVHGGLQTVWCTPIFCARLDLGLQIYRGWYKC